MGQHLAEQPRASASSVGLDLRHKAPVVVVQDRLRNGPEEPKGINVAIHLSPGRRLRRNLPRGQASAVAAG